MESLFRASGAPGDPPQLSHASKWKDWLYRAGNDPNVDSLAVLGNVREEFRDLPPNEFSDEYARWKTDRERVVAVLEEHGFRYYRGGRVLPNDQPADTPPAARTVRDGGPSMPKAVDELLEILVKGLRRAMHPLTHRRKGATPLSFATEHDVQDLLHALLRPWVSDIRRRNLRRVMLGRAPVWTFWYRHMEWCWSSNSFAIELTPRASVTN